MNKVGGPVGDAGAYLHGEHVLVVAVVVAVALEALADAGGGVAGTTVRALADVLEGSGGGRLDYLGTDVAIGVQDTVERLLGGVDTNQRDGRGASVGALGGGDGKGTGNVGRDSDLEVFVGVTTDEDLVVGAKGDLLGTGDGSAGGGTSLEASGADFEELATSPVFGEGDLGVLDSADVVAGLDLVPAATELKDGASREGAGVGDGSEDGELDVGGGSGFNEEVAGAGGGSDNGGRGAAGGNDGADAVDEDGSVGGDGAAEGSREGEGGIGLLELLDDLGLESNGVDVSGATAEVEGLSGSASVAVVR